MQFKQNRSKSTKALDWNDLAWFNVLWTSASSPRISSPLYWSRTASSKRMAGVLQSTWISKIYGLNSWQWARGWGCPCSFALWQYLIDRLQLETNFMLSKSVIIMSHNCNLCGLAFKLLTTYVFTFPITRNYMELYYSYQLLVLSL